MTENEVVEIAKAYAAEKGWAWIGKIEATKGRQRRWIFFEYGEVYWFVRSNAECRGCNGWFSIRDADGTVETAGFVLR